MAQVTRAMPGGQLSPGRGHLSAALALRSHSIPILIPIPTPVCISVPISIPIPTSISILSPSPSHPHPDPIPIHTPYPSHLHPHPRSCPHLHSLSRPHPHPHPSPFPPPHTPPHRRAGRCRGAVGVSLHGSAVPRSWGGVGCRTGCAPLAPPHTCGRSGSRGSMPTTHRPLQPAGHEGTGVTPTGHPELSKTLRAAAAPRPPPTFARLQAAEAALHEGAEDPRAPAAARAGGAVRPQPLLPPHTAAAGALGPRPPRRPRAVQAGAVLALARGDVCGDAGGGSACRPCHAARSSCGRRGEGGRTDLSRGEGCTAAPGSCPRCRRPS